MKDKKILNTIQQQCMDWVYGERQDLTSEKFNLKVAIQNENVQAIEKHKALVKGHKDFIRKIDTLIYFMESNRED